MQPACPSASTSSFASSSFNNQNSNNNNNSRSSYPSQSSSSSSSTYHLQQQQQSQQQHQQQRYQSSPSTSSVSGGNNNNLNNGNINVGNIVVPPGTLQPGTIIKVGEYTVRVDKFLSEGGFAHVYLATSEFSIPKGSSTATNKHVLKRIAVQDKKGVEEVGKEVEVMKLLRNHPKIVNFLAASVSELKGSQGEIKGYEIFILMEWCPGGGIIDMLNTRLQERLTESEILKIFSDTVEAVAHMHYQSPPLIHRDLKVENILLSPPQTYKLCDFGSTTTPLLKIPTAVNEIQALEAEINKTTTLQYRAPELVDVWTRKGYNEKVDIWALGVFLYKLCYYTTPFEEQGPLAILSATYKIPPYPAYSNSIKGLIGMMLQEKAEDRPNIYQVHEQVCRLRGSAIKLENKYLNQTSTDLSRTKTLPPKPPSTTLESQASNYSITTPASNISPMRRGRPSKPLASTSSSVPEERKTSEALQKLVSTSSTANDNSSSSTGQKNWEASFKNKTPSWPGAISANSNASGSTGFNNGFGESFSPSIISSTITSKPTSFPSPALNPTSSPSSSSTLFADLLPHPSTSLSASRCGTPSSNVSALSMDSLSRSDSTSNRMNAFKSSLPVATPTRLESSSTAVHTSFSPITTFQIEAVILPKIISELTGEDTGPPLPRRPQSLIVPSLSTKPELVSRASQTSPALMASWNSPRAPSSIAINSNGTSQSPISSKMEEIMRPAEIVTKAPFFDLLGDDDQEELKLFNSSTIIDTQSASISAPRPLDSPTSSSSKSNSQLLEASRGKFRPTKPDENFVILSNSTPVLHSTQSSTLISPLIVSTLDARDRFPSLDQIDSKPQKVEQWQSIVEKEEESSDEEAPDFAPSIVKKGSVEESRDESFPPSTQWKEKISSNSYKFIPVRQSMSNLPPLPELSSSTSKPWAVPSIAPVVRTSSPLIAPQPQSIQRQAAISSLVSRYENLSTEPSSETSSSRRAPPSLASKPFDLRRGSRGEVDRRRTSSGQAVVDYFEQRFPDAGGLDNHFNTSSPKSMASTIISASTEESSSTIPTVIKPRPLFKPVPPLPSSSPRRPASLANLIAKPTSSRSDKTRDVEEEEPGFIGVSNMRNKWESLTSSKK